MGSLADEVAAASDRPQRTLCAVCNWWDAADPDDQADLIALLDDPGVQATVITSVLEARGVPLNGTTVPRHRRGECIGWRERRGTR